MSAVRNFVVIPTRDNKKACGLLTTELLVQNEADTILVADNSDEQDLQDYVMLNRCLLVMPCKGRSIYEMWNGGLVTCDARAKAEGITKWNVAILNDDIHVPDLFLSGLSHALRAHDDLWLVYPDPGLNHQHETPTGEVRRTHGTSRTGGMTGWAFMVKGEKIVEAGIKIDEEFEWWGGDDDLAHKIERAGGAQGAVLGLGLDHDNEGTAALPQHAWTHAAKARDVQRLRDRDLW